MGRCPISRVARTANSWRGPAATAEQRSRIADLAEQIDAHRKRVLAEHEELTPTGLYNVLEKVSLGGTALSAKEKRIHDLGLVAVLKSLHDELDAAVLAAYGWHDKPSDEQILERLVALNAERLAEEAQGKVRWLRPDFQAPPSAQPTMAGMGDSVRRNVQPDEAPSPSSPTALKAKTPWPASLPEQMAALASALTQTPQSQDDLATRFSGKGKWKARLPELLATLATLGRARKLEDGRWMG